MPLDRSVTGTTGDRMYRYIYIYISIDGALRGNDNFYTNAL